jgi:hypothetical protein
MSTYQRIHARTTLTVDRETADVLRLEAKKVAMFEHDLFEDYLDFSPGAQYGLALRYRDVFDLIDAVGWDPDTNDQAKRRFEVPLTEDLINLLCLRREDLELTVKDRIAEHDGPIPPAILDEITTDRLAANALDRLFGTYAKATAA